MFSSSDPTVVGRVAGIWRYPVKSMAAEPLAEAEVSWHGLAGDRRWAFVRDGLERSGFPWLTLRQRADMSDYRPSLSDPGEPETSSTLVRTPSGEVMEVTDPALARQLHPDGARVIRQSRGIFDTFPLSLITTQTIARLSEWVGEPLDVQRFRPNILVEASSETPFAEDAWVGRVLRLGSARMRVDKRDGRCVVITIDPATHLRTPAILRTVVDQREGYLGVYGSAVEPGRIAVNDLVSIEAGH